MHNNWWREFRLLRLDCLAIKRRCVPRCDDILVDKGTLEYSKIVENYLKNRVGLS